jgi:hypothetical protein
MSQVASGTQHSQVKNLGQNKTARKDAWWVEPLITVLVLTGFLIYAHVIVFAVPGYFEIRQYQPGKVTFGRDSDWFAASNHTVAPYLAPFHSPLIFDANSHHSWMKENIPAWWPAFLPFSSAMLILIFPAGFRFTCYYYRKAYYRAFWQDPIGCAVGEWRTGYLGENHPPLILQNIHRYFMYAAVAFIFLLAWDALLAFRWPTNSKGELLDDHKMQFGMGLGTLIMIVNVVLLACYTFGCHSFRHIIGGRSNCFTCALNGGNGERNATTTYKLWQLSTILNERHMLFAWLSMFSVGLTDFYIRLCAWGVIKDVRFF